MHGSCKGSSAQRLLTTTRYCSSVFGKQYLVVVNRLWANHCLKIVFFCWICDCICSHYLTLYLKICFQQRCVTSRLVTTWLVSELSEADVNKLRMDCFYADPATEWPASHPRRDGEDHCCQTAMGPWQAAVDDRSHGAVFQGWKTCLVECLTVTISFRVNM